METLNEMKSDRRIRGARVEGEPPSEKRYGQKPRCLAQFGVSRDASGHAQKPSLPKILDS